MDSNNQIEPCLSRKSSEGKPQIFTTLRNIDLNLLTIFEAVYVHKGIVNAAKVLNLTPSAISQSIQKLRVIFPDPLFIRKGRGVTPTAFAMHLHEYITQGLESILGALDIEGSYDKQRTITIATTPRSEHWSFLSSIGRLKLTIRSFYCATRPSATRKTNSVSFKPISSSITCFAPIVRCNIMFCSPTIWC